jgi:predicted nucleic acid-binding protein
MRGLIADTTPLFGAIDPNDQYHSRAQLELERIEIENLTVFIPFPVYVETYSLLLYRLGFSYAYNFTQSCIDSVHLINPTEEEYLAAVKKVSRYPDQKITLVDAIIAVLSEKMNLPVWSYDYHFDIMGIPVWR